MITITRMHTIHAGHRVFGQKIVSGRGKGGPGPCSRLHGHQYKFELVCFVPNLNEIGMVIDFAEIKNRICKWLDNSWDHKFLIWEKDNWAQKLKRVDPSVVLVPFNPTAENISSHLVNIIGPKVLKKTGVTLVECITHETDKCSASYKLQQDSIGDWI